MFSFESDSGYISTRFKISLFGRTDATSVAGHLKNAVF